MSRKSGHTDSMVLSFDNIKKLANKNLVFRKAIYKGAFSELVVMSIPPWGELGEEKHEKADEILFIVDGRGDLILDGRIESAHKHDAIFVTAGQVHNLRNSGECDLKIISVFSPPPSTGTESSIHRMGAKEAEEQIRHAWEQ